MSKVADSIRRGLREAVAYAEGNADESVYRVHVPAKIDVKAIRKGYGVASCMNTLPETGEAAGSLICKQTRAPDSALIEPTRGIPLNANRALTTE